MPSSNSRTLAANLMRVVRGAGDPDRIPDQLVQALKRYEKHVKEAGGLPKPKAVRKMLDPETAMIEARRWIEVKDQETVDYLNLTGMAERQEAEELMRKGALQMSASMLLGQHTQSIAGEHQMYEGHHLMRDALAAHNLRWRRWQKERDEEEAQSSPVEGQGRRSRRGRSRA